WLNGGASPPKSQAQGSNPRLGSVGFGLSPVSGTINDFQAFLRTKHWDLDRCTT
ncbi:hypothetical protein TNCV_2435001, partial [Trichonephila clavipes]